MKKSDRVREYHENRRDWVRVDHEKKSEGV